MIIVPQPKFKVRDEFFTTRNPGSVHGTASEPVGTARTVVDTTTALSIVPRVGTALATQAGVTFGGSNNRCSYASGYAWMDFPTGFDASAYADQGLIVIMYDSAGVAAWCYLGAAGSGETLGSELITSITNSPTIPYETLIVNANGRDVDSAIESGGSGLFYTNEINIPGSLVKITSDITLNSGTAPLLSTKRGTAGSLNVTLINPIIDGDIYRVFGLNPALTYVDNGFALYNNATISNFSLVWSAKQVLTPSATGCYAYKDAALSVSGWNKPTAFNMNSASYTFGIYEPQSRGKLFCMGGKSTPAWGDPGFWLDRAITRAAGQVIAFKINVTDVTSKVELGLDADKTGELTGHRIRIDTDKLYYYDGTTASAVVGIPADATDYVFIIILRAAGALFFRKRDTGYYKFLGEVTVNNTASLYAGISGYSAAFVADLIRVCNYNYLPAPVLSDSFTGDAGTNDGRLSDGLAHAETSGLGAGGAGVAWSGASGAVDGSGRLVITPTLGSELVVVNGSFDTDTDWTKEVGWTISGGVADQGGIGNSTIYQPNITSINKWYCHSFDVVSIAGGGFRAYCGGQLGSWVLSPGTYKTTHRSLTTGSAATYVGVNAAVGTTGQVDNVSTKEIVFSSCTNIAAYSVKDVDITAWFSVAGYMQAGVILGLNDGYTNFILCYYSRTYATVVLLISEAGIYTIKASVAAAYSADAPLRVRRDDREIWVWYNGVLIGTGPTTTLSGLESGNLSGLNAGAFSTSENNSFSKIQVRYVGTAGEYDTIKRIVSSAYAETAPRVNELMPMGSWGAGMGIAPALPPDTTTLDGTFDRVSPNFANYIHTPTSSILGYSPKGYYRIGHPDNATYSTYGVNSVEIRNIYDFPTTAAANAEGFALHRAFIDGGDEIPGFFSFKYQASNNSGVAASIKNGLPISAAADHNPIAGLTGISVNQLYSAIDASKLVGTGFHCMSIFQYQWLRLVALAHAQASTSVEKCAFYNATYNYPKGGNNNALKDVDDTSVIYTSDGYLNCGRTGSGQPFAKTTHNGQECGIADLNGNLYEIAIGVTCIATSKTVTGVALENPCRITINGHGFSNGALVQLTSLGGSTQLNDKIYTITVVDENNFTLDGVNATSGVSAWTTGGTAGIGTFYVAKQATQMADFTSGATVATDHWGATGVAAMMDAIAAPTFETVYPNNGFAQRWGSGANQVLDEAVSGDGWIRTAIGLPKSKDGIDTTGTDLFGKDLFYQYIRDQLCVIVGGYWVGPADAGVGTISWAHARANMYSSVGFRAAYTLPAS